MSGNLKFIPGDGPDHPEVIIIGEAPGKEEHNSGVPFVGRSGKLLRKLVQEALPDVSVYYTNVVKVRPENNRTPTDEEIKSWRPLLLREIFSKSPAVIVTVGAVPAKAIYDKYDIKMSDLITDGPITSVEVHYHNYPVVNTYHPAYALRNPDAVKQIVQDLIRAKTKV